MGSALDRLFNYETISEDRYSVDEQFASGNEAEGFSLEDMSEKSRDALMSKLEGKPKKKVEPKVEEEVIAKPKPKIKQEVVKEVIKEEPRVISKKVATPDSILDKLVELLLEEIQKTEISILNFNKEEMSIIYNRLIDKVKGE